MTRLADPTGFDDQSGDEPVADASAASRICRAPKGMAETEGMSPDRDSSCKINDLVNAFSSLVYHLCGSLVQSDPHDSIGLLGHLIAQKRLACLAFSECFRAA